MATFYSSLTPVFTIRAYTLDGAIYCPECSSTGDASIHGVPVYDIDARAFSGICCDSCRESIEGVN